MMTQDIPARASDGGPENIPVNPRTSYLYILDDAEDAIRAARVCHDDIDKERAMRISAIEAAIDNLLRAAEVMR